MSGYQYTYPTDTSFIDAATEPGREVHGFGRMFGSVVRTGSGYDAYPDDGRPQQTFATRDEAFEYVAGPPMAPVGPGEALRAVESMR